MRIAYQVRDICDYVGATTAKCQLPLYGRWVDLTVTAYCLSDDPFDAASVAMSYGARPLDQRELLCNSFDATQDGVLRLSRGSAGNRQDFDQRITFPLLAGEFFDRYTVADGGVPAAREVIRGVLRGMESIIETIRQSVRASFPANIKDLCLRQLDEKYGQVTVCTIRSFLGQIHWRLMLAKSGCDEQQLACIETMAGVNPPRFYDVNYGRKVDIPLVGGATADIIAGMQDVIQTARYARNQADAMERQREHDGKFAAANDKALSLLEQICGERAVQQFKVRGYVAIEQDGYKFEIPANALVRCTDPNGKRANLCIHTQSFQVNPIDDIILSWLHIKHKLAAYLKEAIPQGVECGFQQNVA